MGERRCERRPEARPCPLFTCETAPPGRRGGGLGPSRGAGEQRPPPRRGKCYSSPGAPGRVCPVTRGQGSRARGAPGSGLPVPAADLRSAAAVPRSLPRPGGPGLFPRDRQEVFPLPSRRAASRQGMLALYKYTADVSASRFSEDSLLVLQYPHFLAQEKVVLSALSLSSAALWEPTKWEVVPEPCQAAEEEIRERLFLALRGHSKVKKQCQNGRQKIGMVHRKCFMDLEFIYSVKKYA
ncbi:uncharacterized protein LOC128786465 [Vidua chalybeata]|uniref:uncharacterized protein LOC128786465 n=1 Tax=Vidua chalybeata TaxID=81927 RepID=UPI0023A8A13D|nr:uncharacterized protein LOC128786465 [Vidua chalybeata]